MADTDSLERIRKALEEIDALPVEHSPAFKTAFAFQRLQNECSPVAIRSLLAREAALREALESIIRAGNDKSVRPLAVHLAVESARAALASTEPTKD